MTGPPRVSPVARFFREREFFLGGLSRLPIASLLFFLLERPGRQRWLVSLDSE